jgi:DNA polymerase III alpha subunit (gram-positive type)
MNYLLFDCETTGKPKDYRASYEDIDNWPRVTQLAWMLCNDDAEIISQYQSLIKPDGWEIPKEKFFIDNNMSTERCEAEGVLISDALDKLMEAKLQAEFLVAHNLVFDNNVVWSEFLRAGIQPRTDMTNICTMESSTKYCAIPSPYNKGFKWPRLIELHIKLFGKEFEGAHDAMDDVIALKNCFFELINIGVIKINTIELQGTLPGEKVLQSGQNK